MKSKLKSPLAFALAMAAITALAVGVVTFSPEADAHSGGLAKDGCHRDKAAGERHFHFEGTRDVAGTCLKEDGKTVKIPNVPALTDTVLELRASIEGLSLRVAALEAESIAALAEEPATPALSKVEAYKLCFETVEGPSYASYASETCRSIPVNLTQDFTDCFKFVEEDSYASAAVDECKGLLGIQ